MAQPQYIAYNAVPPTTAVTTHVSTGTSIKTLLQVTAPSSRPLQIVQWGITFSGAASNVVCELINTTTVAGGSPTSVTPTVLTPGAPAALATAGHSPSSEGSIVSTVRVFDYQKIASNAVSNGYKWEYSLGREPVLDVSQVLRVRVHASAAVDAVCWIQWEE